MLIRVVPKGDLYSGVISHSPSSGFLREKAQSGALDLQSILVFGFVAGEGSGRDVLWQ